MNIIGLIESAEHQFKQILEEFFIAVYDEKSLSSHGIDHHRRVWTYSKELLLLLPKKNTDSISTLPSKLIIASYLHDIGMSVETGLRHGKHSRDLGIQFLVKNNLPENDYMDVLEAIENHDRKDYSGNASVNDLLTILSVADDLDAFGFTGIFRYSEIYLTRGIKHNELGNLIIDDAGKRFENFKKNFRSPDYFARKHKKRYEILCNFFNGYNEQVISYKFGGKKPLGYCGVVELLSQMIKVKIGLKELYTVVEKHTKDQVIQWFLNGLKSEID
ncbi:MAG: HD domain-containing protein [Bacteroidia bacterium]|nr:HD domain-containing protein [Bacteroidia bacterium]